MPEVCPKSLNQCNADGVALYIDLMAAIEEGTMKRSSKKAQKKVSKKVVDEVNVVLLDGAPAISSFFSKAPAILMKQVVASINIESKATKEQTAKAKE
jgi:hypothetical protein